MCQNAFWPNLLQKSAHGSLTVRIQNWSKMDLMGQKRSRFAHGDVRNDYRRTFALKMVVSRKRMVSRKRSLTLISQNGVRFLQNGGFAGKVAHARSRSAHAMGSVFRKMVQTAGLAKNPAHASLTEWHFENRRKRHSGCSVLYRTTKFRRWSSRTSRKNHQVRRTPSPLPVFP